MILASAGLTFMSVNALPIFSKLDVQSLADRGAAVCMPQQLYTTAVASAVSTKSMNFAAWE